MSILDLIPEAERTAVVAAIVNERPFEPASANEIALRWCVMKLAATPTVNPDQILLQGHELDMVREQRNIEAQARAEAMQRLESERHAHEATKRAMHYAGLRAAVFKGLLDHVTAWDRHYGTAEQQDDALQAALHETVKKLDAINAAERKP